MKTRTFVSSTILLLPLVTIACFQSPPSSQALERPFTEPKLVGSRSESTAPIKDELVVRPERKVTSYARKHATRYGLDWTLVVAVMDRESSFRHNATSRRGAYGLMQIMPHTRAELEEKLGIGETVSPSNNVKAGAFYLKRLSRHFVDAEGDNRIKLTLAAYNAGLSRIQDAQDLAEFFGEDPLSWDSIKSMLPLLSKRYKGIHQQVWENGKMRGSYFRNPGETIRYVDLVLESYDNYSLTLR